METQSASHPPADVLLALGAGKLDDATAEAIFFHVEVCPECLKTASRQSDDSFLAKLRAARGTNSTPAPRKDLSTFPPDGNSAFVLTTSERPSLTILPELRDHPQYQVLRELGRGGMGVVYLAKNKLMDRLEVLKVVNKQLLGDAGATERFLREIRSAAQLNHPNIVTAYSALQAGELLLFSMEYIEGRDLAEVVKSRGPLPAAHCGSYVLQAARGLQHAFEKGMIHRDIKPQNLILDGKKNIVKILDFGLAKATRTTETPAEGLTGMNMMMGTPDYMAPEQARDAANVDIRADIYSLGCTLYCLLAGRAPFVGGSLASKIAAHQLSEPDPVESLRQDLPPDLAGIVRKMMAKDPEERYQKPEEVVQALTICFKGKGKQPTAKGPPVKVVTAKPAAASKLGAKGEGKSIYQQKTVAPIAAPRQTMRERPSPVAQVKMEATARQRKKWLMASGGAAVVLVMLGLIGLWAAGVFRVKTADGILIVQVNEPNAEVFVDGDRTTVSWNEGRTKAEIHVKPGTRKVEVKKDGFSVDGAELTFKDGDRAIFTARLLPNEPRMAKADAPPPEKLPTLPEKSPTPPDVPPEKSPTPPDAPPEKSPTPPDTKKPDAAPVADAADDNKGFVPLFNGKNLKGWKTHSSQPGKWRVVKGVLIGSGPAESYLYSERSDYKDFHLRAEARINDGGNSGLFFRTPFGPGRPANKPRIPQGYEAQINSIHSDSHKTGSLFAGGDGAVVTVEVSPVPAGEWFTEEVIAEGNHIVIKVNGKTTADYTDDKRLFTSGHLALQQLNPQTVAEFRKIELKELTHGKTALAPEQPVPTTSPADPFQPKSVWVDDKQANVLTVIERKGDTFRARFEVGGGGIVREVTGVVKDGKLSWLAKDARAIKGRPGDDNQATITSDKDGDLLDFTYSNNGRTLGAFVLRLKTGK